MATTRKRKPVAAARIEMDLWFVNLDAYKRFGAVMFGERAKSISERTWVSVAWEYADDPEGGIEAVFQFTHTCRNDGAYRSDATRFFNATCRRAGVNTDRPECEAGVVDVRLCTKKVIAP